MNRGNIKEWWRKKGFPPIDGNAEEGQLFPFTICCVNGYVIRPSWGSGKWGGGGGPSVACRIEKKPTLSHVIVTRNKALFPVSYQNLPCHMSLTILGLMSPVEFKKRPCRLSLGSPCRPVDLKNASCHPVDFTGNPLHRENRGNGQKKSMSRKTQGIWKFCQNTENTGNLVCSSCKFPDSKGKGYCDICRENLHFFPRSWIGLPSQFCVCNSHKLCKLAHGKFWVGQGKNRENTGNLKITFE